MPKNYAPAIKNLNDTYDTYDIYDTYDNFPSKNWFASSLRATTSRREPTSRLATSSI